MYIFNDDYCYEQFIGDEGISEIEKSSHVQKLEKIFKIYQQQNPKTKYYKILFAKDEDALLGPIKNVAASIRNNFQDVIIVGMGGAYLNPASILSLRRDLKSPKIHFLKSTDPLNYTKLIGKIEPKKTAVLVISKSGSTTETISMLSALLKTFEDKGITNFNNHFFFITENNKSPIRDFASSLNCEIVEHDQDYGGRFSGFSSVGLLPGLIAGLNMESFLKGQNDVCSSLWENKLASQPMKAALSLQASNKPILVSIGYLESIARILQWHSQIVGESLGKDKNGITPIWGTGPEDQHSLLQLYLDGPRDKIFNMIHVDNFECEKYFMHESVNPAYLKSKHLEDINKSMFNATLTALRNNKIPTRSINIEKFDEYNMGALMMHFAIEVITVGHMMNINPFDQPGVEQIKVEARKLLSK